jgi:hypothetical protein
MGLVSRDCECIVSLGIQAHIQQVCCYDLELVRGGEL